MQFLSLVTFLLSFTVMFTYVTAQNVTVHSEAKLGIARLMRANVNEKHGNKATWYDGVDLDNAACFGVNGLPRFDAKDSYMIGAMAMDELEQCFKCVEIINLANKKKVTVQIVDVCGRGCQKERHVDLTTSAFQSLAPLEKGELKISFKPVACPAGGIFETIKNIRNKFN